MQERAQQAIRNRKQTLNSADYLVKCLLRARRQLDKIGRMIAKELDAEKTDTRRLRDLTDSQTRVSEWERTLDGRPLPGSHRPQGRAQGPKPGAWLAPMPAEAEEDPAKAAG